MKTSSHKNSEVTEILCCFTVNQPEINLLARPVLPPQCCLSSCELCTRSRANTKKHCCKIDGALNKLGFSHLKFVVLNAWGRMSSQFLLNKRQSLSCMLIQVIMLHERSVYYIIRMCLNVCVALF